MELIDATGEARGRAVADITAAATIDVAEDAGEFIHITAGDGQRDHRSTMTATCGRGA